MFDIPCKLCKEMITQESQEKHCKGDVVSTARMLDYRRFAFGISGVFRFIINSPEEELPLNEGDFVCYPCMVAHPYEEEKSIICSQCNESFQPCFGEESGAHKSGWGCSSTVDQGKETLEISCGFGSRYDTSTFLLKKSIPVNSAICDECLGKMIASDEVTHLGSYLNSLPPHTA